jgi:hypothetical protein
VMSSRGFGFALVVTVCVSAMTWLSASALAASAPLVEREFSSNVTSASADLNAGVNPEEAATKYRFEYGPDTTYGTSVPVPDGQVSEGSSVITVTQHVAGLKDDTTYHYRVVAVNAEGTTDGPDHVLHTFPLAQPVSLPDNRAYEMVSPTEKNGTDILTDPFRDRVSENGDAVTFAARAGFAGSGGLSITDDYLAQRTADGWVTHGLTPSQPLSGSFLPSLGVETQYFDEFSPDLSMGIVRSLAPFTNDPNVSKVSNLYLRDNLLADVGPDPSQGAHYTLLSNAVTPLKANPEEHETFARSAITLVWHTPDFSHVLFESLYDLTQQAVDAGLSEEVPKMYEWEDGTLRLAGILPDSACGSPPCVASASFFAAKRTPERPFVNVTLTPGAISEDGSKVFFAAPPFSSMYSDGSADVSKEGIVGGPIYMRIDHSTTVQLNVSERAVPDPEGPRPAQLIGATPDGSRVFFETAEQLTEDANASSCAGQQGEQNCMSLYMYDTTKPPSDPHNLTLISRDGQPSDGTAPGVFGNVATSGGGSYVYFGAAGMLAPGQTRDLNQFSDNFFLYVWHDGTIREIANLDNTFANNERPLGVEARTGLMRATPNGKSLLFDVFGATGGLTGYDDTCALPESSITTCREVYLYRYDSNKLTCVSCNPSGEPPVFTLGGGSSYDPLDAGGGFEHEELGEGNDRNQIRAITDDGSEVFFTTADALLPQDTNGQPDVYEYDVADETLHLISTGQCNCRSEFVGVTGNGSDVFFTTAQKLVRIDQDGLVDLYDARVGGGIPAQNAPPPAQCQGEACQSAVVLPNDATPSSITYSGPGNTATTVAPLARKVVKHVKKRHVKRRRVKRRRAKGGHATRRVARSTGRRG